MTTNSSPDAHALAAALTQDAATDRLRAAMLAGTTPHPEFVGVLVARAAVEPDFFVRDMITWALVRHEASATVPALIDEVATGGDQAVSQSLHTLSKIGDVRGWEAITPELLRDPRDDVARTAWRAAAALVPEADRERLADELATQLGRGDRSLQASLSRAFATLGESALSALRNAASTGEPNVRAHAVAAQRLVLDPEANAEELLREAAMLAALADAPTPPPGPVDDADR